MLWSPIRVRPATADDVPVLLDLDEELRELGLPREGGRGRTVTMAGRSALAQRYLEAIADPDRHLVLAVGGKQGQPEQPVGMALLTVGATNALLDVPAVHLSHSVVSGAYRRRGAGRALVAAAAAFAEDRGIEQLVVSVHPGSRDAARFYARLGFMPVAVRRAAPVSVVRRRLATEERSAEQVLRRRPRRGPRANVPLGQVDVPDS